MHTVQQPRWLQELVRTVDLGGQCQVACNFGGHAYNVN